MRLRRSEFSAGGDEVVARRASTKLLRDPGVKSGMRETGGHLDAPSRLALKLVQRPVERVVHEAPDKEQAKPFFRHYLNPRYAVRQTGFRPALYPFSTRPASLHFAHPGGSPS